MFAGLQEQATEQGEQGSAANALLNMSELMLTAGARRQGLFYAQQAYGKYQSIESSAGMFQAAQIAIKCLIELKELDEAERWLSTATSIAIDLGVGETHWAVLFHHGLLELARRRPQSALEFLLRAKPEIDKLGDPLFQFSLEQRRT